MHPASPIPQKSDVLAKLVMHNYAPTLKSYGFHFKSYAPEIFTPIIRGEIRRLTPKDQGYYLVYLPSYSDEKLIKHLSFFKGVKWKVFSKHASVSYSASNVEITPVHNDLFVQTLENCTGCALWRRL